MFELTEEEEKNIELQDIDKWVLKEINAIAKKAKEDFLEYNFHDSVVALMNFIRDEFASNYLELVKRRAYNNAENIKFSEEERNAAVFTLRKVLKIALEVLYPIEPALTYYIYKELFGEELHKQSWPEIETFETEILGEDFIEFNSAVWKAKKEAEKSLKDDVKKAVAPQSLKSIEKELKAMHNISELEIADKIEINV
jgi:valyl-tRNA synthetase